MPQKKKRIPIPRAIEAEVLFASDRTCCVCHVKGRRIQIHHIDDNPANNEPNNLAVLCLECHNETQIRGGFGRILNADQVIRYRDDWLKQVATSREVHFEDKEQIEQKMMGIVSFREAIKARDWEEAKKVLQKYPNLHQGRSSLGLSMSYEVQEYFFYQLPPVSSPQVLGSLDEPVTLWSITQFAQTHPAPHTLEAIHWLKEALQYEDDPDGNVTASLALMYGYHKEYGRMIDTLKKACSVNSSFISYFQRPVNLMMLIYACHDLASVEEVMQNVNLKLPQKDEVRQALREASDPKKNSYVAAQPYIEWYAVEFRPGNISGTPVKVPIAFPGKNGSTYAQIIKKGQWPITTPTQPSSYAIETLIPVDEVLKQLTDSGIVLITTT